MLELKTIKSRIKVMEDYLKKVKTAKHKDEEPNFPVHILVSYVMDLYSDALHMYETYEQMESVNGDIENLNSSIGRIKELIQKIVSTIPKK